MLYLEERKKLCECVRLMFDRKMTNTAGGNISVKVSEDHYIMTPTLMSQRYHCHLSPNQILVLDQNEKVIEGDGKKTREINMHMACYEENRDVKCVVHAHAIEAMFFATMGIDMPNITEASQKLGEIRCLDYRPATTKDLAELVREQVKKDMKSPKAYLLNKHGVLVLGENLEKTYDLLERLEWNAHVAFKYIVSEQLGTKMRDTVDWETVNVLE